MNYLEIYNKIILRAQNRNLEGYKEKHHIVPLCMDGTNEKSNIVKLTAREHFICHWLLCRIYSKNKKLVYAFWFMCNAKSKGQKRHIPSSRAYQEAKILRREILKLRKDSDETRLKKSLNNARKGKPNWNSGKRGYKLKTHKLFHSQETKAKMSLAHKGNHNMKGKKHSEETKRKMRLAHKGRIVSEETKKKMSLSKQNMSEETKKRMKEAWVIRKQKKNLQ